MKANLKNLILVIVITAISFALRAAPIYFTFSGVDGGTLSAGTNGLGFNNLPFSFQLNSDTSDLSYYNAYTPYLPVLSGTITVTGLGTYNLVGQSLYVFNNQGNGQTAPVVGFGVSGNDFLDVTASGEGLETYGMNTSFGPISASPYFQATYALTTSGGQIILNVGAASDLMFQAVLAVPEPTTVVLYVLGLFLLSCCLMANPGRHGLKEYRHK